MKSSISFLGPVDQLPAEGSPFKPSGSSEIEICASLFSDSNLWFDVTLDGVTVISNPQATELFQLFKVDLSENASETPILWSEEAFEISLQGLFPDSSSFETLSDASEPEDFVRRFLEVISSSLDHSVSAGHAATLPLIRWVPGEDGNSARVQLLGLLLADESQFEAFCRNNAGDFGFIFEDAEIQAHGIREAMTVLALVGITLGSATKAEAGLFQKSAQKKEMRIQQIAYQESVRKANAAIPTQAVRTSGWQDVHRDAYVNHELLAAGKNGQKKVVVDVSRQRAYLLIDGQIAIDTAVSTAREGKYTPRGEFKITERVATGKTSSIYGCSLPYWQRLGDSAVGLHIGDLPGYPASAGCIRLPESIAPILYTNMSSGVTVQVVDSWSGPAPQSAPNIIVAQVIPNQGEG